jgi:hypothetical protein
MCFFVAACEFFIFFLLFDLWIKDEFVVLTFGLRMK